MNDAQKYRMFCNEVTQFVNRYLAFEFTEAHIMKTIEAEKKKAAKPKPVSQREKVEYYYKQYKYNGKIYSRRYVKQFTKELTCVLTA